MKQLSVIVALFDTMPYLEKCMDSILSQSFENFELIVVDNISGDGSYEYMENLAKKDSRIRLYRRDAHGNASTSREIGRKLATGEFITYVDSDDSIKPGMYETLMRRVRETRSDIAVCNYDMVYPDRVHCSYSAMRDEVFEISKTGYEPYFFQNFCASPPNNYLWTRVIRRELYEQNGIFVPDVEISEDTIFTMLCTSVASRVAHLSDSYYNYYQREDSSVRVLVRNDDVALRYVQAFEKMVDMVNALGLANRFRRILPFYACTRIRSIVFYKNLAQPGGQPDFERIRKTIASGSLPKYLRLAMDGDCMKPYAEIYGSAAAETMLGLAAQCL